MQSTRCLVLNMAGRCYALIVTTVANNHNRECYCGNARDATSTIQSISDCNMPCSGNKTEICGAGNRLSLYKQLNFVPAPAPTEPPTLSGYDYVGCLADNVDDRTLYDRFRTTSDNNHTTCASFCSGYEYFGVEFGTGIVPLYLALFLSRRAENQN